MKFTYRKMEPLGIEFSSIDEKLANVYKPIINDISILVDVGVSDGRFIKKSRNLFRNCNRYIGIDPIDLYNKVTDFEFVKGLIGKKCAEVRFNVTSDLFTSSKLYLGEKQITSQQYRLDCLLNLLEISKSENIFLKLDTQGMDVECLESAKEYLTCIKLALIEIQMRPFSEGMLYFSESILRLRRLGFEVCEIFNPINRVFDGSLGQIDLLIAPISSSIFESGKW